MTRYSPPYTITDKMLELVSLISEKIGRLTNYHSLETRPHLRRNNKILSVHSSLKIESNSLSLSEVKDVISGHTVLGSQKEIQEVKNAYTAYEQISHINPTSLSDLKKIHGVMTDKILDVKESGHFRLGNEGVFSGGKCVFMAPPPQRVESLINDLLSWLEEPAHGVHPLIASSIFHYEFVFIHPFVDGNGRMARLWQTVILYRWKPVFEYIPLESQIEKFQEQYYEAISQSHINGNSNVFIEFILEMIDKVLDQLIFQLNTDIKNSSDYVKRMLGCMEYDVMYSSREIMDKLGLKSKETFRKNYLGPAISEGLVKMSIPDKPNQKYIKV